MNDSLLDAASVERYLSDRLGDSTLRVSGLKRSPLGLSRETWFATLSDRKLVLRCDLPGDLSSVPVTLRFEYEVYRRLEGTGVPAARALWYEEDSRILGRQFYVREMIDGDMTVANFDNPDPRFDDLRIEVSKEHARKMARVHQVDWKKQGFDALMPAPPDAASCGIATVDRIQSQFERFSFPPSPMLSAAMRWLREHAPRSAPAVCLCKGSNGAMQEIWRGTEIVGMSDWELASLGDPANDWARCAGYIPVVPGRWGEQQLLDYYESISGLRITTEAMAFYRLIYAIEMILVAKHAGLPINSGKSRDARLAMLATSPIHQFEMRLAQAMGIVA